jgi:hypothetical protein
MNDLTIARASVVGGLLIFQLFNPKYHPGILPLYGIHLEENGRKVQEEAISACHDAWRGGWKNLDATGWAPAN